MGLSGGDGGSLTVIFNREGSSTGTAAFLADLPFLDLGSLGGGMSHSIWLSLETLVKVPLGESAFCVIVRAVGWI